MTMVIENQNRQCGGMSFDNVYHHNPPQFTDPWAAAHTSSHSTPPVYATSMGNSASIPINSVKSEEVGRNPAMSMPYPNIPVSAPSLVPGSNYTTAGYGPEVMGMQHEVPRSNFEQPPAYTTAPPIAALRPEAMRRSATRPFTLRSPRTPVAFRIRKCFLPVTHCYAILTRKIQRCSRGLFPTTRAHSHLR